MPILVIEDDVRVADFLGRGLRAEGYQVMVARTGAQGLDLAREHVPELLILDLMLPDMDGLDVCRTLRAEQCRSPILMLSARGQVNDRIVGLRLGADDYLAKPFAFDELLARVEALIRRSAPRLDAASELRVADLVFDNEAKQVRRGGVRIELTAKELLLLELLMRAPGRVFSRERILSNIWGLNEDPLTNIVDVFISRLRSKIDEGHPLALIKTVRSFGYKIDDAPT